MAEVAGTVIEGEDALRHEAVRPELAGVRVAGQGTGEELTIDPWVVGVGIGARF